MLLVLGIQEISSSQKSKQFVTCTVTPSTAREHANLSIDDFKHFDNDTDGFKRFHPTALH